jgi:putative endonuclease
VTEARLRLGQRGEDAARAFLEARGIRIVAANFSCSAGEIDLVGQEGTTLIFVEVKTRSSRAFGPPQFAVHHRKQRQIARAAQWYLAAQRKTDAACRFDVLAVTFAATEAPPQIDWIRDAFPAEGVRLW